MGSGRQPRQRRRRRQERVVFRDEVDILSVGTPRSNNENKLDQKDESRKVDDVNEVVLQNKQLLGFTIKLTEDDDDYDYDHEDLSSSPYDIADYLSSKMDSSHNSHCSSSSTFRDGPQFLDYRNMIRSVAESGTLGWVRIRIGRRGR